jgi:hypothetical protein
MPREAFERGAVMQHGLIEINDRSLMIRDPEGFRRSANLR